jgi:hypothetical protein
MCWQRLMPSTVSVNQPQDALSSRFAPRPLSGSPSKPISNWSLLFITTKFSLFPGIPNLFPGHFAFFSPAVPDLWWDLLPSDWVSVPMPWTMFLPAKSYAIDGRIAMVAFQSRYAFLKESRSQFMGPFRAKRPFPAKLPRLLVLRIWLVAKVLRLGHKPKFINPRRCRVQKRPIPSNRQDWSRRTEWRISKYHSKAS